MWTDFSSLQSSTNKCAESPLSKSKCDVDQKHCFDDQTYEPAEVTTAASPRTSCFCAELLESSSEIDQTVINLKTRSVLRETDVVCVCFCCKVPSGKIASQLNHVVRRYCDSCIVTVESNQCFFPLCVILCDILSSRNHWVFRLGFVRLVKIMPVWDHSQETDQLRVSVRVLEKSWSAELVLN